MPAYDLHNNLWMQSDINKIKKKGILVDSGSETQCLNSKIISSTTKEILMCE